LIEVDETVRKVPRADASVYSWHEMWTRELWASGSKLAESSNNLRLSLGETAFRSIMRTRRQPRRSTWWPR